MAVSIENLPTDHVENFDPLAPSPFREIKVSTRDGLSLAGRVYEPLGPIIGGVLIAPAMAVPQRYYEAFASHLAGHGYMTLTFDYRGMGDSRPRKTSLRRVDTNIVVWAEQDLAAALSDLSRRVGSRPITWIGHSLGGQVLPLVPNHHLIDKVVTVATGSGYWRQNSPPLRKKVPLFWFGFVPVLTPLFGYFPGARLGMVGDLPRGVIRQWRQWCLDPDYLVGVLGEEVRQRFADFAVPMTSLSATDDEMMSADSIASIHGFYVAAQPKMIRLAPEHIGMKRIGHFGFFKPTMREVVWDRYLLPELAR